MSDMFFEEEKNKRPVHPTVNRSKMSQWLMDKGIAKTESMATYILIAVAVVAFGLAILFLK